MNLHWYLHSISISRLFLAFPLSFYVTSFSVNKKAFFHCFRCRYLCARALSLQAILYRVGHILGRHTPLLLLSWSLPPPGEMEERGGEERRGKGKQEKANLFRMEGRNSLFFFKVLSFQKKNYVLIFALLGVCCRVGFSLVAESRGHTLVAGHGLLIAMASLVAEHKL